MGDIINILTFFMIRCPRSLSTTCRGFRFSEKGAKGKTCTKKYLEPQNLSKSGWVKPLNRSFILIFISV